MPRLDVVYVPIGLGSGACSAIAAKLALGREVRIVGVVSSLATTYADSLAAGRVVASPVSTEIADACMAVRVADQEALDILIPHLDHIVQVTDAEVADAMRILFTDTHNVAEGAGAAALAAALQERESLAGRVVGLTMTGATLTPTCSRRCSEVGDDELLHLQHVLEGARPRHQLGHVPRNDLPADAVAVLATQP